ALVSPQRLKGKTHAAPKENERPARLDATRQRLPDHCLALHVQAAPGDEFLAGLRRRLHRRRLRRGDRASAPERAHERTAEGRLERHALSMKPATVPARLRPVSLEG